MKRPVRIAIAALASCLLATLPAACGPDDGSTDGEELDGGTLLDGGTHASDGGGNGGGGGGNNQSPDGGSLSNPDAACVSESAEAELVTLPVDIIIAIDNSCSMSQEIAETNNNINREFADIMGNSGLDYRVVMVSRRGTTYSGGYYPVCVDAPLGGADCGANCGTPGSSCPRYLSVNQAVDSTNALDILTRQAVYEQYSDFLRPNSQKYFLVITDDESAITPATFNSRLANLTPPPGYPAEPFKDYVFHAIYGYPNKDECRTLAQVGHRYTELVNATGGQRAKVCETDWKPIFNQMAQAVVAGSKLSCEFNVPEPPPGKKISASSVSVLYTPGGSSESQPLAKVADEASCPTDGTKAFYFDDNSKPTKVFICPSTCPTLQNDATGKVQVLFKCSTTIG